MASTVQKSQKQKAQIKSLKQKQHWMKMVIFATLAAILLLLLLLGYATDWTRGLRGASSITPTSTSTQDEQAADDTAAPATGNSDSTGTNSTNETSDSTDNSTSTTTNRSTTTNNSTTTTNTSQPPQSLIELDIALGVGDNINDAIDLAESLGLDVDCSQNLVIQNCTFSKDGWDISTKSLLGTNLITSVVSDLE